MNFKGDLLEHAKGLVTLSRELQGGEPSAFERAADRLGIDPSVLRRRIQALATWVGAPLLEGRGSTLRLSALGQATCTRGERLLADAAALRQPPRPAPITIGCTGTIVTELLPTVLLQIERELGGTRVTVRRVGSTTCARLLAAEELDLGVVRGIAPPPGFAAERLCDDRLWLVAPKGHRLLSARRLELQSIAQQPLIVYGSTSQTRARVLEPLAPFEPHVRVEVDGKAAALQYVARGLGIAFVSLLPSHAVKHAGVALRDVTHLFGPSSFWLLRSRQRSPAVDRVARMIKRAA